MLRTVQKEFRFEAAHRLIQGYPGNCKNLHGHSYYFTVVVALHKDADLDEYGFVKDFADFKLLKNWVDENMDHTTLVSQDDLALITYLTALGSKIFVFPYTNTTAELLAEFLFKKAEEFFNTPETYVCKVAVKETCTSEAVYSY